MAAVVMTTVRTKTKEGSGVAGEMYLSPTVKERKHQDHNESTGSSEEQRIPSVRPNRVTSLGPRPEYVFARRSVKNPEADSSPGLYPDEGGSQIPNPAINGGPLGLILPFSE